MAWAQQVIQLALQAMRTECETSGRQQVWAVFECRVVGPILEGKPPPDYRQMVEHFQFVSPTQASNVLVTAKRMYARALRSVIAQYVADEQEVDAELSDLQAILAQCGSGALRVVDHLAEIVDAAPDLLASVSGPLVDVQREIGPGLLGAGRLAALRRLREGVESTMAAPLSYKAGVV